MHAAAERSAARGGAHRGRRLRPGGQVGGHGHRAQPAHRPNGPDRPARRGDRQGRPQQPGRDRGGRQLRDRPDWHAYTGRRPTITWCRSSISAPVTSPSTPPARVPIGPRYRAPASLVQADAGGGGAAAGSGPAPTRAPARAQAAGRPAPCLTQPQCPACERGAQGPSAQTRPPGERRGPGARWTRAQPAAGCPAAQAAQGLEDRAPGPAAPQRQLLAAWPSDDAPQRGPGEGARGGGARGQVARAARAGARLNRQVPPRWKKRSRSSTTHPARRAPAGRSRRRRAPARAPSTVRAPRPNSSTRGRAARPRGPVARPRGRAT